MSRGVSDPSLPLPCPSRSKPARKPLPLFCYLVVLRLSNRSMPGSSRVFPVLRDSSSGRAGQTDAAPPPSSPVTTVTPPPPVRVRKATLLPADDPLTPTALSPRSSKPDREPKPFSFCLACFDILLNLLILPTAGPFLYSHLDTAEEDKLYEKWWLSRFLASARLGARNTCKASRGRGRECPRRCACAFMRSRSRGAGPGAGGGPALFLLRPCSFEPADDNNNKEAILNL